MQNCHIGVCACQIRILEKTTNVVTFQELDLYLFVMLLKHTLNVYSPVTRYSCRSYVVNTAVVFLFTLWSQVCSCETILRTSKLYKSITVVCKLLQIEKKIQANMTIALQTRNSVLCSAGQYLERQTGNCISCPSGTFNNMDGFNVCMRCSSLMTTRTEGSKSQLDCGL